MDGLECAEILKSDLEYSGRIDSEYYQKKFLGYQAIVENNNSCRLSKLANFLIGPFGSAYNTSNYVEESEYRYVRGQDVKPFILKDTDPRFMDRNDFARLSKYSLVDKDILVSVVGTLGNACIVQEKDVPAIFSCKSTVIRTHSINPYFLIAYLNSEYGKSLLVRQARGAIQKGLNLDDLKILEVPIFSEHFQSKIEEMIKKSYSLLDSAKALYIKAEQAINKELGFDNYKADKDNISILNFSDSFNISGRLDAEYYQKKYDGYFDVITKYKNGYISLSQQFEQNKTPILGNKEKYNYIEIGDVSIATGVSEYNLINYEDLPANAKIAADMGDLLVSKVRPYRGAVSIIRNHIDDLVVSNAFTVLREKGYYKKEVLFILFKIDVYKDWLLKWNVGSSYPVIKDEDILNMPIPNFSDEFQNEIYSYEVKRVECIFESDRILQNCINVINMAIEQGEEVATKIINEKF